MLGWSSEAITSASKRSRRNVSSVGFKTPVRIVLMATMRLSRLCLALKTSPIPPLAISLSNSNSPISRPTEWSASDRVRRFRLKRVVRRSTPAPGRANPAKCFTRSSFAKNETKPSVRCQ